MNFLSLFKGIGHVLAKAFGIVKQIVPEEQLVAGIELVRQAADQFAENQLRRGWVLEQLQAQFHIPESVARLIVEIAVQHVKHDVIDKAVDQAKDAASS